MTPFAIAGIQMHVAAVHSNVEAMRHRIEIAMARFPWTQMVLFSELAPFGPLPRFAQPFENETVESFQAAFNPVAEAILGDIPNYTDLQPDLQISEVAVNASRSEKGEMRIHGH